MVFVRVLHRIQHNTYDISTAQLLTGSLGRSSGSDTGARHQEDTIAKVRKYTRIGNQQTGWRIEDDPIKNRGKTVKQHLHPAISNEFARIRYFVSSRNKTKIPFVALLDDRDYIRCAAQIIC